MTAIDRLQTGPVDSDCLFLFAHGAGAPMDSPFMNKIADLLAKSDIRVERFEFPYMAARRDGKRKGPDRQEVLVETWKTMIASARDHRSLFIGGKSLGGRIATMVADPARPTGVICFGYPFHPPGRPEKLRTAHLRAIETPVLILQGERDPFGVPSDVDGYELSHRVSVEWIPDGDHSLKPRKRSGRTLELNLELAAEKAVRFIKESNR